MKKNIAILGGGNLGRAIAQGLSQSELSGDMEIYLTRRNIRFIEDLKEEGIRVTSDNEEAVVESELVILAVQPKQLDGLLEQIKSVLDPEKHILVSVITGTSLEELQAKTHADMPIIRAMPNTAIALKESMTCIATNGHDRGVKDVIKLFDQLGSTLVITESLMQAATVLGACGIAFFLRFIRAASQGGIEVGFHAEEAQLIAAQTAKGAAALLLETDDHPERAIDRVTTPQGCTIAGLNEMEHYGLSSALIKGIVTSYKKIETIKS
jgi:pyrroline-5-carboxylate reductase